MNWGEGLFGRTLKEARYRLNADMKESAARFIAVVKVKGEITDEHKQLYQDVLDFIENEEPDEEWTEWPLVNAFLGHYRQLNDTRRVGEKTREYIEARMGWCGNPEAEMMCYYPEEYGRAIPSRGAWVMILREIPVEEKYRPGLYNAYYAKPSPIATDADISTGGKPMIVSIKRHLAKIAVEAGEVMLWPYEYLVIKDPSDILQGTGQDKEYEMVRLGGTANYDAAKIHYLGTRGVSEDKVYSMLLGDINAINYCYFRLKPEYFEQYDYIVSAMLKGITYEMACRLYYRHKTGKPMFKLVTTNATSKPKPSKGRKKGDTP